MSVGEKKTLIPLRPLRLCVKPKKDYDLMMNMISLIQKSVK
jgi:hypothetical protein